ncbi:hypothetical protein Tco_0110790 [Tanacetum coccineum]
MHVTFLRLRTFQVRRRSFPLRSLSLYDPLHSAPVTSYGPSHLGPSFPLSLAWLASLFRYTRSPSLKLVLRTLELSRLIFKTSFFCTISISAVLKVGMPISAGITASVLHAFIPSLKLLFALSTKPLACGCLTEAKRWRMHNFSHQSLNGLSLNCFPLSDINSPGFASIHFERGFRSPPSSIEVNPRDQVKSISTTIEADLCPIHLILDNHYYEEEGNYGPKFMEAYGASHIDKTIPRKEKDPGSFTLPCFINNVCFDNALVELGANVSVMPLSTYLNLGLSELAHTKLTVELADRTVKYPKAIAENILVGIGKFTFPIDFIILDMPEDIKGPLILRRPFLSTAHAKIDVYKRKITLRVGEKGLFSKVLNLLVVSLDPMSGDYIELNDLNVPIELRRDQVDDLMPTVKEGGVVEEFRARNDRMINKIFRYPNDHDHNNKIHIEYAYNLKFSCMIVLEDMDDYRDEEMGDVIFGKLFLKEVGINARWFDGMITIYNGNDVVSEKDKMNGISHAYQNLKGFYKGVLNLGPDYIRDTKMKEWLTRGHISGHDMEWLKDAEDKSNLKTFL